MTITRSDTNKTFDKNGNLLSSVSVVVDITEESILYDLHIKARTRVAAIDAALASVVTAKTAVDTVRNSAPATLPAAITELKRLATVTDGMLDELAKVLKTDSALIRLIVGNDLLVENTST